MGVLLMLVRPAKPEGLGALFQKAASHSDLAFYPGAVLLMFTLYGIADIGLAADAAVLLLAAAGFLAFAAAKSVKWFGGITGDVLGASAEGAECFLWMALWLLHYFAMS
jgi:adenosylcobinamide-GDP ribazoletransferase